LIHQPWAGCADVRARFLTLPLEPLFSRPDRARRRRGIKPPADGANVLRTTIRPGSGQATAFFADIGFRVSSGEITSSLTDKPF
jgi:hypothetical protein